MKLQELRKNKNLSQSQLAELSGVKLRMIQQYEIGARSIDGAKLETLCSLAVALGVNLWDILDSEELAEKVKRCTISKIVNLYAVKIKDIFCNDGYIEIDEEKFAEIIDEIAKEIQ